MNGPPIPKDSLVNPESVRRVRATLANTFTPEPVRAFRASFADLYAAQLRGLLDPANPADHSLIAALETWRSGDAA